VSIFQDPFLDNDNEWEIRDDEFACLNIVEGDFGYDFVHRRDRGVWTTWQPLEIDLGVDYKIHTVIQRVSGPNNGYGLIWRCVDEENCYSFEISKSGHYRVRRCREGNWSLLRPWTASRFIRTGEQAMNELLVVQFADRARFYINEHEVAELAVPEQAEGHGFGFLVNGRLHIRIHSVIVLRHVEWQEGETAVTAQASETSQAESADSELAAVLSELHALVGMDNIKQEVNTFINFLKVQQMRQARGLSLPTLSYHMVLLGPPGTGKTTVARLIGRIYKALGILKRGHVVETDRAGLVAPYVGQTAARVHDMVEKALDGILFIDEAYALLPQNGQQHDFGQEAIEALLKRMEDYRGRMAVIIAGYADEMNRFLEANPGVKSRFNRYFYFDHYKPLELMAIFSRMAEDVGLKLTDDAREHVYLHFREACQRRDRTFGNGRYARNLLEKVMERQANRIVNCHPITDDVLVTVDAQDIPAYAESAIF
jgi:Holliday junction resolvasome RuvABC ATP-dependent DNA helicase subunit